MSWVKQLFSGGKESLRMEKPVQTLSKYSRMKQNSNKNILFLINEYPSFNNIISSFLKLVSNGYNPAYHFSGHGKSPRP
jgi:hypothetical protein